MLIKIDNIEVDNYIKQNYDLFKKGLNLNHSFFKTQSKFFSSNQYIAQKNKFYPSLFEKFGQQENTQSSFSKFKNQLNEDKIVEDYHNNKKFFNCFDKLLNQKLKQNFEDDNQSIKKLHKLNQSISIESVNKNEKKCLNISSFSLAFQPKTKNFTLPNPFFRSLKQKTNLKKKYQKNS